MIIGWLRLFAFALVGLTIVYFIVGIYSRSVRREKLEKQWAEQGLGGDRDAFVENGMNAYEHGLKKRLLWLIYIIPMVVFVTIVAVINWQ